MNRIHQPPALRADWLQILHSFWMHFRLSAPPISDEFARALSPFALLGAGACLFVISLLFRWTYGRFRVRRDQLLRVWVYGWASLTAWQTLWAVVILVISSLRLTAQLIGEGMLGHGFDVVDVTWNLVTVWYTTIANWSTVAFALLTLALGMRQKLQFRRGFAIVVTSVLITALACFVLSWMISVFVTRDLDQRVMRYLLTGFPAIRDVVDGLTMDFERLIVRNW